MPAAKKRVSVRKRTRELRTGVSEDTAEKKDTVRVFSFGCWRPDKNLPIVEEQIRNSYRYHNNLVALCLERRKAFVALRAKHSPALAEAEAKLESFDNQVEEVRKEIRRLNASEGKRSPRPELAAQIKELYAERKAFKPAVLKLRKDVHARAEFKEAVTQLNAEFLVKKKALRADCEVYWGTYTKVEEAVERSDSGPAPPKFKRNRGDGHLGVQIQNGAEIGTFFSNKDTRLRIEQLHPDAFEQSSRLARRTYVHMRVASEGRNPVFARMKITMHRPIPEDAIVKGATLLRKRIGTRDQWSFQLVLQRAGGWPREDVYNAKGAVGVDIGWRLLHDEQGKPLGLRVAYWAGSDGGSGQLVVPFSRVEHLAYGHELQSRREKAFNLLRKSLVEFFGSQKLTDPLKTTFQNLAHWRNPLGLSLRGYRVWSEHRIPGDEALFDITTRWRVQDVRLYNHIVGISMKTTRWRTDLYRCFAATLRRRYATIVLEDVDWANMQKKANPEDDHGQDDGARRYRRAASPGSLKQIIQASGALRVVVAPSALTTKTCHVCSKIDEYDSALELVHTCSHCGAVWDQDFCAASNLLKAAHPG